MILFCSQHCHVQLWFRLKHRLLRECVSLWYLFTAFFHVRMVVQVWQNEQRVGPYDHTLWYETLGIHHMGCRALSPFAMVAQIFLRQWPRKKLRWNNLDILLSVVVITYKHLLFTSKKAAILNAECLRYVFLPSGLMNWYTVWRPTPTPCTVVLVLKI